jgi:hypothetical protein
MPWRGLRTSVVRVLAISCFLVNRGFFKQGLLCFARINNVAVLFVGAL